MSKGPKNWFKGVLSTQDEALNEWSSESETDLNSDQDEFNSIEENQMENEPEQENNFLFSRENMDEVTLDMVVSVENLLKDRQLVLINNKALKEHLHNAYENINRLKSDVAKQAQIINDKEQEYNRLEDKLSSKQMSYDQLLEDYKEYQYNSHNDFEGLKNQLEKEVSKYKKLDQEFTDHQYKNMQIIKELEEKIRNLEVENQKITEQHEKAQTEKNQLLETFNDFSERMSFSFSQKSSSNKTFSNTDSE